MTERRRRTEERILEAARALFARNDYETTTIRAVAAVAEVDPALVIRYFGDKEGLFRHAIRLPEAKPDEARPDGAAEQLNRSLAVNLNGLPPASLALLRSMFAHPEAAARVRGAMQEEIGRLSGAAPGPDAVLRSGLAAAMLLGITVGRGMLDVPALAEASVDDIQQVMRPVLRVLMGQGDGGPDPSP